MTDVGDVYMAQHTEDWNTLPWRQLQGNVCHWPQCVPAPTAHLQSLAPWRLQMRP